MEYYVFKRLCLYDQGTGVNDWWDNLDKQISFCRGGKGFIAFNNQYNTDLNINLQVNLITKPTSELLFFCTFFMYHHFILISYVMLIQRMHQFCVQKNIQTIFK